MVGRGLDHKGFWTLLSSYYYISHFSRTREFDAVSITFHSIFQTVGQENNLVDWINIV